MKLTELDRREFFAALCALAVASGVTLPVGIEEDFFTGTTLYHDLTPPFDDHWLIGMKIFFNSDIERVITAYDPSIETITFAEPTPAFPAQAS